MSDRTVCKPRNGLVLLFAVVTAVFVGCTEAPVPPVAGPPSPPPATSESPNKGLLDEVNAANRWFHARKVRPIRARLLEADQMVETLEGTVNAKAGDYLCRGAADELWPQSAKSLHERYTETDDVDAEGWRQFTPRPDAEGVLAVAIAHPFSVQATWGQLNGKSGDYLCKKFSAREEAYPEDVWIVDAALFRATYAAVGENGEEPISPVR